jgi:hypothetical protein
MASLGAGNCFSCHARFERFLFIPWWMSLAAGSIERGLITHNKKKKKKKKKKKILSRNKRKENVKRNKLVQPSKIYGRQESRFFYAKKSVSIDNT